jgi:hypothetical protein
MQLSNFLPTIVQTQLQGCRFGAGQLKSSWQAPLLFSFARGGQSITRGPMNKKLKHVGDAMYWVGSGIAGFLAFFACPGVMLAYLTGHSRLHHMSDAIFVSAVFLVVSLVGWGAGRAFRHVLART